MWRNIHDKAGREYFPIPARSNLARADGVGDKNRRNTECQPVALGPGESVCMPVFFHGLVYGFDILAYKGERFGDQHDDPLNANFSEKLGELVPETVKDKGDV